ncbi:S8 family serine peptidase [Luteimicrobium sp. DT211]|uniref:S8 family serine peptidase n=1 Tax=Luteimicrobium sp. DT211 TaxID=3393412 RepID=UPI003CF874F5
MTTRGRARGTLAALLASALVGGVLPAAAAAGGTEPDPTTAQRLLSGLDSDERAALDRVAGQQVGALHFDDAKAKKALSSDDPVKVIVGFKQQPAETSRLLAAEAGQDQSKAEADAAVKASHDRFSKDLTELLPTQARSTPEYKVATTYTDAFNGVAMTLPGDDVATLLDSDEVAGVWPDATVTVQDVATDVGAAAAATTTAVTTTKPTAASTTRSQTDIAQGITQLHSDGVTGKGVKVGIIDTGIDYDHPDLKAVYAGGYDFVDHDSDPMETTYAQWKASGQVETNSGGETYYTEHGTHVAGIIAGQAAASKAIGAHGVAPGVQLYSYRVLGPYGSGSTSAIISAMGRALDDGVKVVNMSLGAAINDPLNPESTAADNLALAGVTTAIAAGNSGPGSYTLGSPGAAPLALTVGANDTPLELPAFTATVGTATAHVRVLAQTYSGELASLTDGTGHPLVDVGTGTAAGYAGKDVKGKVVVVQRGGITLNEKVLRAATAGAAGVLLVDDNATEGHIPYYLGESQTFVPTFSVTAADGAALRAAMATGAQVAFAADGTFTLGGDSLASFSSRGPVYGTDAIKPEVTAPGVAYLSSIPADVVDHTGQDYTYAYARLQGTSMATPYVAGAAALLLQAHPGMTPAEVKTALMNTAVPLAGADYSVFDEGAGQIDPYAAVHATVSATVQGTADYLQPDGTVTQVDDPTGALSLGTFALGRAAKASRTVVVRNDSSRAVVYSVDVAFGTGGGVSSDAKANKVRLTTLPLLVVPAHRSVRLPVLLTAPKTAAAGYYEGTVTLKPALGGGTKVHVPFGLRVVKTGLGDIDMLKSVLSTNQGTGAGQADSGQAQFDFVMEGQLRSVEALVEKTDGTLLGYVAGASTVGLPSDTMLGTFDIQGHYLPVTGDDVSPFDQRGAWLTDGAYRLVIVGTDAYGNQYTKREPIYVDTKAPAYDDGLDAATNPAQPYVVERAADDATFHVSGTLDDAEVPAIQHAGISLDQSSGRVLWSQYSSFTPEGTTRADAKGVVDGTIALPVSAPAANVWLWPQDAAGNLATTRLVHVVKKGTLYVVGSADKGSAGPGDTVTYTITAHGMTDWKAFTSQVRYDARNLELVSAAPTPQAKALGASDVTLTTSGSGQGALGTAAMSFTGDPVTADGAPLVTFTYKVRANPAAWTASASLDSAGSYGTTTAGAKAPLNTFFFGAVTMRNPTASVSARPAAQALLTDAGAFDSKRDYALDGITAALVAPDGTRKDLTLDSTARTGASGLAPSLTPYRLEVRVPGHFTWYEDLTTGKSLDGGIAGQSLSTVPAMVAGDVNGDDVIDVRDAYAIYKAAGTSTRADDVNHDGTVDAADLQWVVTNYLAQNTTADHFSKAVTSYRGLTLNEIVAKMS